MIARVKSDSDFASPLLQQNNHCSKISVVFALVQNYVSGFLVLIRGGLCALYIQENTVFKCILGKFLFILKLGLMFERYWLSLF